MSCKRNCEESLSTVTLQRFVWVASQGKSQTGWTDRGVKAMEGRSQAHTALRRLQRGWEKEAVVWWNVKPRKFTLRT